MRGDHRHGSMPSPLGNNDTFDPFAPAPRQGRVGNYMGSCNPELCATYCNAGQQHMYPKVGNLQCNTASSCKMSGGASSSKGQQVIRNCDPCENQKSGANKRGWPSAVGDRKTATYNIPDPCAGYNKRIKKEKTGLFSVCVPSTCPKLAQANQRSDASAKGRRPEDHNDSQDDGEGSEGSERATDDDGNADTDADADEEEDMAYGDDDMNKEDGAARNNKSTADSPPDEEDDQEKGGFEMSQASWSLCKAAALFLFGVFLTKKMHIVANAIG